MFEVSEGEFADLRSKFSTTKFAKTRALPKAFVERYLHLAIEELLDIANHFVSFYQWREPAGYRDLLLLLTAMRSHIISSPHEQIF
jgi:uncharacterized protein YutE (UPF0331/DUF86 family)